MESLFDKNTTDKIISRLNKLNTSSTALWGKMNVSQMVLHAQAPLKVAFEEIKLKRNIISFLFGAMAKKQLMSPEPFKKNLPTAPAFNTIKLKADFEKEKNNLITYINRFQKAGSSGITQLPHPFFGKMTTHEWDTLQWKHLDHHLRQFGV